jgi:hypothetical protein
MIMENTFEQDDAVSQERHSAVRSKNDADAAIAAAGLCIASLKCGS